ncbi:glycoside hydrolase family 18 protein [Clavulina sp. PMI_390]|nr:glycoside hydrolase family 18 protein [Clavulina sp. PMI_390]
MLPIRSLSTLAIALATVNATPLQPRLSNSAPHWVVYSDGSVPTDVSTISGYHTVNLAFLLSSGAADSALAWQNLDDATRTSTKAAYAAAGISLLVTTFGSTELPTTSGLDPNTTASNMAAWVQDNSLDGIEVAMSEGKAEAWLITFTQALRAALPSSQYLITHSVMAPWFSPIYTTGAYTKVNSEVGSLIDWYNIEFYNEGSSEYTTCAGLLTKSSSGNPSTSVFEINSVAGVPLDKIVIGKPATSAAAASGYVAPATLAGCLSQAQADGWTGGVSVWEYPQADSTWIATVRSSSWAV